MKTVFLGSIFLLSLIFSQVSNAKYYSSNRCQMANDADSVFEKIPGIGGKFKKIQESCCKYAIKHACERKAIFDGCRGSLNAIREECNEDCELFVKDCDDYLSSKDVADAYLKDED